MCVGLFLISLVRVCLCVAEDLHHPSQSALCLNLLSTYILAPLSSSLNTSAQKGYNYVRINSKNYFATKFSHTLYPPGREINLTHACAVKTAAVNLFRASFSAAPC